jgi:hypothetical protein
MRCLLMTLILLVLGVVMAQNPCAGFGQGSLTLKGIGVSYYGDLDFDSAQGSARLYHGVCAYAPGAKGAPLWVLRASEVGVTRLSDTPQLSAKDATLTLSQWTIKAPALVSSPAGFKLTQATFSSHDVSGHAANVSYSLDSGEVALESVRATSHHYRVSGATAQLAGQTLYFQDAAATTCLSSSGELYFIQAPDASLDLLKRRVKLTDSVLHVGAVQISLAKQLELSPKSLQNFEFPLVIEYVGDNPETGAKGTGLGVRWKKLALAERAWLELGVTGLLGHYPLYATALLHVSEDGVSVTLGPTQGGVQADVRKVQPLLPYLDFDFGVRIHHWAAQDFLHEGFVGLKAHTDTGLLPGDKLKLSARGFAAVSNQMVSGEEITSPRLGVTGAAAYTAPKTALGKFSLRVDSSFTDYPSYRATQYGVRLRPGWRGDFGPLTAHLGYDLRLTDSGSPFSTHLDKLEPISTASAGLALSGPLGGGFKATLKSEAAYDFLVQRSTTTGPMKTLSFSADLKAPVGALTLEPAAAVDLAGLLWPNPDLEVKAYAQGSLTLSGQDWDVGLLAKYNLRPAATGWEKLETSFSFPLNIHNVTLTPFVALNFAPTLFAGGLPTLSGEGLTVAWRTCCGTLHAGFKAYDNKVTSSLSVSLEDTDTKTDPKTNTKTDTKDTP